MFRSFYSKKRPKLFSNIFEKMSESELSSADENEEETKKVLTTHTKNDSNSGSSSSSNSASNSASNSDSEDEEGLIKDSHLQHDAEQQSSDSDEDDADMGETKEVALTEQPKKSKKTKASEPQDELSAQIDAALARSNRPVEVDEDFLQNKNQATANSLVEKMDKAYDTDYQKFLAKQPSFERIRFLQDLYKKSNDHGLTKCLVKAGILDRFKKWFLGLGETAVPTLTVIELILQILKSFNLKEHDLTTSDIVQSVRELSLKPDSQANRWREELLSIWKRSILKAKSGAHHQKSTDIQIDEQLRDTTQNQLYIRKNEKRNKLTSERIRERKLMSLGVKNVKDDSLGPQERQRIYKSVNYIRQRKH